MTVLWRDNFTGLTCFELSVFVVYFSSADKVIHAMSDTHILLNKVPRMQNKFYEVIKYSLIVFLAYLQSWKIVTGYRYCK
jgi:hypothetical protein